MTDDRKLTDFRRWAISVLDLLSAEPERQLQYLQTSGVGADEMLLQFDDLLHVARARVADGSLSGEDYRLLQAVGESVNSVSEGPEEIWTESALEEAVEWEELRVASAAAKSDLELSWDRGVSD
ncbi:hypothetical protein [Streptomyces sp. GC420]|uniref:hypothetical protein n=1 Tax=Streptomyces sp. GC420 TaxID=2697568 RepID=UPI0014152D39|nr:hypothetical protein [Streptomyces sp. GC420]NBM15776.1 hypothetical protein [Streptomyces sp. GC420]